MTNQKSLNREQYQDSSQYDIRTEILKFGSHPLSPWQWLAKQYDFSSAKTILELGCGNGLFWQVAASLLTPQQTVVATDFSAGMLAASQTNLKNIPQAKQFSYQVEDAEQLSFSENHFEVVLAHLLMHLLSSPLQALHEIKRMLTPGGFAGITVFPNDFMQSIFILANELLPQSHYKSAAEKCSVNVLERELTKLFSRIEKLEYVNHLKITESVKVVQFIRSTSMAKQHNLTEDYIECLTNKADQLISSLGALVTSFKLTLFIVTK
ncbi:MAG: hypothetical protein A3E87_10435 [Gammaproteobacteria bacterium RIFCSPHIGHO2_12_FULL_35_23]|nr:MAG: hypothetical protein A3E87_10435 [Gammaproteobacteria bacterium RIFCSPHIGHO2_12_FULL_35_23]